MAGDDPGARRHRRPRLGDHPAPAHLGGVRAPRRVQRPADRVPGLQPPLPGRPPPGGARRHGGAPRRPLRPRAVQAPRRPPGLRPHRGARVQPDVRDADRAGEGRRLDRLPPPGDRAGHLPRLQDDASVRAQEAAVRDRPGGQVVPERDHAGQLHLPHARVRADGDGVLRAAGRGGAVARVLDGAADGVVRVARNRPGVAEAPPPRRGRAVALLERHERHRVPVSDRLVRARGNRQPRRLRPPPARRVLGSEAGVQGPGRGLRAARDRARGGRGPDRAGAPVRRLRRGRHRRRAAHRAAARAAHRADQGRRPAAREQGRPAGEGARRSTRTCARA